MNPFEITKDPDGGGITVRVKNEFVVLTREEERRVTKRITEIYAENEKLRKLAKAAWGCVKRQVSCDDCRIVACGCTLATAMRECGIEVKP